VCQTLAYEKTEAGGRRSHGQDNSEDARELGRESQDHGNQAEDHVAGFGHGRGRKLSETAARGCAMKRQRGLGLPYLRGEVWWIQYNARGDRFRESSGSAKRADAVKLLKWRIGEIASGKFVGLQGDKTTVAQLIDILLDNYRMKGLRSIARAEDAGNHIKAHFGGDEL